MPPQSPSKKDVYDATLAGAADRPPVPHLQHDPQHRQRPIPRSLEDYRAQESVIQREARLRALWKQLPAIDSHQIATGKDATRFPPFDHPDLTPQRAEELRKVYVEELFTRCGLKNSSSLGIDWNTFQRYAEQKEAELWSIFHDELDLDGNGHLDAEELRLALDKAGISISPTTVVNFMAFLTSSPHSRTISFPEFRDFLLLLPRKPSAREIFQFYQVRRYLGDDTRGPARVNMEGDVSLSAEDRPLIDSPALAPSPQSTPIPIVPIDHTLLQHQEEESQTSEAQLHQERKAWFGGVAAAKYLLAGGIAGAVSRTATAPFDRIKVFLITQPPQLASTTSGQEGVVTGVRVLVSAITRLHAEGGILAFWVGNGLNVVKIFPESAIKFFAYESSKRFLAKYWDGVDDSRNISGGSRFVSGGIGGITSQLSIYPIETLKTQMMSSTGEPKRGIIEASKKLWALGGMRAYYRGLVIGLVGVFPYSAIDMSTFEALKIAYVKSYKDQEPGVLETLAFGSIAGGVGATSVYPLNLVRTRLQASGSSGHPQRYTGVIDVTRKTYQKEGWRGFYRGLLPTLAKVVPAVSISYVVYEESKRRLGVV